MCGGRFSAPVSRTHSQTPSRRISGTAGDGSPFESGLWDQPRLRKSDEGLIGEGDLSPPSPFSSSDLSSIPLVRDAALEYAKRGWAVFPVEPRGKRPIVPTGVKSASTDLRLIEEWWDVYDDSNIGLATGASELVVIDIDDTDSIKLLPSIPPTLSSTTPSGGRHLFYAAPPWKLGPTVGKLPGVGDTPGIDLRAGESYVILPPSVGANGERYEWNNARPIAPCPTWLRVVDKPAPAISTVLITSENKYARGALRRVLDEIRSAPDGTRNDTLNRAVFPLRRFLDDGKLDADEVYDAVEAAALEIGLEPREIGLTLRSALGIGR